MKTVSQEIKFLDFYNYMSSIKINENLYTSNTCQFDAVMQYLFTLIADRALYSEYVSANIDNLLFVMIRNANADGVTVQTYVKRAKILFTIKPVYKPSPAHGINLYFLNCQLFIINRTTYMSQLLL